MNLFRFLMILSVIFVLMAFYIKYDKDLIRKNPEFLTELYFEDHLNLPNTSTNSGSLDFSFTINNKENEEKNYKYSVIKTIAGNEELLDEKEITVEKDKSQTVEEKIFSEDTEPVLISVYLHNNNQRISFWMNK